ncbi:PREDICTED: uncharacterized protein LOC104604547 isoform X2 [Nelumbo nucifera]|uniref:Uncharacterized protein LOC104604547 isoform X2 n=1 Tax=Nelumbo nucifera TaxID=4432 RepID=A0A1U8AW82_NELNU|nr:PREDICTED: uncharacterized protein LOC104604547 isoform X2 [Nelumbo nucifera]
MPIIIVKESSQLEKERNQKARKKEQKRRMTSSSVGGKMAAAALQKDVPWRASPTGKPVPKIHHSPILRLPQNSTSNYALAVMKHPDPIGGGFALEAKMEAAGPECIVPGQITPIRLLSLKVWPINVNMKFMEPVERELRTIGKFMDSAFNLMNASFTDR